MFIYGHVSKNHIYKSLKLTFFRNITNKMWENFSLKIEQNKKPFEKLNKAM